jgi:hypothetical protein
MFLNPNAIRTYGTEDCQLPIAHCQLKCGELHLPFPSIGNWKSAIGNPHWQTARRLSKVPASCCKQNNRAFAKSDYWL